MIKLGSKRLSRSLSKLRGGGCGGAANNNIGSGGGKGCNNNNNNNIVVSSGEIKWEMRPGGMLVQKRESCGENMKEGFIIVRVSTVSRSHDITIQHNSTFGELKMILSMVTSLAPNEQRLLYKGKEREDDEFLHMVGVREKDKVLLLEDPAIKERKLLGLAAGRGIGGAPFRTISV